MPLYEATEAAYAVDRDGVMREVRQGQKLRTPDHQALIDMFEDVLILVDER